MSNESPVPFSTTIHVRDHCLCLHVQRAARSLARLFDDALRPVALTNNQFSLMMALNRPSPVPMKPVAELLAMDQTTLTAALKVLQKRELVIVEANPEDRRSRLLSLTVAGQELLAAAVPIWTETHAVLDRKLNDLSRLRQDLLAIS